jgi:hypothetical protein
LMRYPTTQSIPKPAAPAIYILPKSVYTDSLLVKPAVAPHMAKTILKRSYLLKIWSY